MKQRDARIVSKRKAFVNSFAWAAGEGRGENVNEKKGVLAKIIAFKMGYDEITAEAVAADMIRDDFPKNGVLTMGAAIRYIDNVQELRRAAGKGEA